jgi:hypothetical protein
MAEEKSNRRNKAKNGGEAMIRLKNCALILSLLEELKAKGSWGGETHIQKAAFFLKTLAEVPVDFAFILYKHGPFSFDLRDELTAMRADGLLLLQSKFPYGPILEITDQGKQLIARHPITLEIYGSRVRFVADKLGGKGVNDLEKLATALFVIKSEPSRKSGTDRANRIHELKPHVSFEEANPAVTSVEEIMGEFETQELARLGTSAVSG